MGLFSRRKRPSTDDPTVDAPVDTTHEDVAPAVADDPVDPGPEPLEAFDMLVEREWARIAQPGTWWTAGERVAIAADALRAAAGEALSGVLPDPVEEATKRIAADAAGIRGTDVARWELEGLDAFAYIETVGIVSRLMALDVAAFGLGRKLGPIPEPATGEPSRQRPDGAAITTGWAPTIGPAAASSSLTAVPAEADAMFDLHGVLYLTIEQMFELQIERDGLTRPQIELAAARTSTLNECFY